MHGYTTHHLYIVLCVDYPRQFFKMLVLQHVNTRWCFLDNPRAVSQVFLFSKEVRRPSTKEICCYHLPDWSFCTCFRINRDQGALVNLKERIDTPAQMASLRHLTINLLSNYGWLCVNMNQLI